jgi:hypothetical protein
LGARRHRDGAQKEWPPRHCIGRGDARLTAPNPVRAHELRCDRSVALSARPGLPHHDARIPHALAPSMPVATALLGDRPSQLTWHRARSTPPGSRSNLSTCSAMPASTTVSRSANSSRSRDASFRRDARQEHGRRRREWRARRWASRAAARGSDVTASPDSGDQRRSKRPRARRRAERRASPV